MSTHLKKEWFDDDSFWIDQYPSMCSDQRFADAADHAERLVALVNPHGREVLDLGCGPGRFAIPCEGKYPGSRNRRTKEATWASN
jgi:predicted RNA methylase